MLRNSCFVLISIYLSTTTLEASISELSCWREGPIQQNLYPNSFIAEELHPSEIRLYLGPNEVSTSSYQFNAVSEYFGANISAISSGTIVRGEDWAELSFEIFSPIGAYQYRHIYDADTGGYVQEAVNPSGTLIGRATGKCLELESSIAPLYAAPAYSHHYVGTFSGEVVDFGAEALDFADTNADGFVDIVVGTSGRVGEEPIRLDDPRVSVIHLNEDFRGETANTSQLQPNGWINDFIFTDQDNDGILEIVGNDHGRELVYDSSDWNQMKVYEWDKNQHIYVDLTHLVEGNHVNFYHGMHGSGDVNLDGYQDIFVAGLSGAPHNLFLGNPDTFFVNMTQQVITTNSLYDDYHDGGDRHTSAGVAGVFDFEGDGDADLVSLPYDISAENTNLGLIFEFEGGNLAAIHEFSPHNCVDIVITDFYEENGTSYGFSTIRFADINNDGLEDIVAHVENPFQAPGQYKGGHVSFIQTSTGIECRKTITDEPLIFNIRSRETAANSDARGIPLDSEISLIDLDADGDVDLFLPPYFDGNPDDLIYSLFFNDGSGLFSNDLVKAEGLVGALTWRGGARLAVTDLNSDEIADYVVFSSLNWVEPVTRANEFGTTSTVHAYISNPDTILSIGN